MNIIAQVEFELAYYDAAVHHINHNVNRTYTQPNDIFAMFSTPNFFEWLQDTFMLLIPKDSS